VALLNIEINSIDWFDDWINWRAPTSIATVHDLPCGLKRCAKPQNRRKKLRRSRKAMSGFAKLFRALRANYALLHYWLEPVHRCCHLRRFAKQLLASQSFKGKLLKRRLLRRLATLQLKPFKQKWSIPHEAPGSRDFQNDAKKLLRLVWCLDKSMQILASFCEDMSGFAKLLGP